MMFKTIDERPPSTSNPRGHNIIEDNLRNSIWSYSSLDHSKILLACIRLSGNCVYCPHTAHTSLRSNNNIIQSSERPRWSIYGHLRFVAGDVKFIPTGTARKIIINIVDILLLSDHLQRARKLGTRVSNKFKLK